MQGVTAFPRARVRGCRGAARVNWFAVVGGGAGWSAVVRRGPHGDEKTATASHCGRRREREAAEGRRRGGGGAGANVTQEATGGPGRPRPTPEARKAGRCAPGEESPGSPLPRCREAATRQGGRCATGPRRHREGRVRRRRRGRPDDAPQGERGERHRRRAERAEEERRRGGGADGRGARTWGGPEGETRT